MPIILPDMSDLKKRSTLISEVARRRLSISRDDYALNQYIHYRCADPRQKVAGWCCDAKEEIAEFIGVTRPGLYQMMKRNEAAGLLEFGILGAVRATAKWVDCENDCKQSLHEDVNKVYTDCKQSLHRTVNKVYKQYKVKEDISKNKEEEEKNASLSSSAGDKNFSLEAEKEKNTPPIAPAPPVAVTIHDPETPGVKIHDHVPHRGYPTIEPAGEWQRVDVSREVEAMKTDDAMREAFSMGRKIPSSNYADYLEAFRIDVSARGETYAKPAQLRTHFLNWSGTRFAIAQRNASNQAPKPHNGQPAKIRQL